MLIGIGNLDVSSLLDAAIALAKDETVNHELNREKGKGSWTHDDGWGIAFLNENNEWIIEKSTAAIYSDTKVDKFRTLKTKIAIIHVRKKMGSDKSILNTHPFIEQKENNQTYVFCHNGYIDEDIYYDSSFPIKGETDSEKLFYSILTDLRKDHFVGGIRQNFRRYKKLTGTNIILATKERSVIALRENHFPTYYQMSIGKKNGMTIVSSEVIPKLDLDWEPLDQGDILQLTHNDHSVEIHKIRKPILPRIFSRLKSSAQNYQSSLPKFLQIRPLF